MEDIKQFLTALGVKVYPMHAEPGAKPPYVVYGLDGADDFAADGIHAEKADTGTIDLYTQDMMDPLKQKIENGLDSLAGTRTIVWYLNSVQTETEAGTQKSGYTGLLHFEWVFEIGE